MNYENCCVNINYILEQIDDFLDNLFNKYKKLN